MARVSIYVPDEMKSDMDGFEDKANWSNIAQQAFGQEIKRLQMPKENVMNDVIERLRASKAQHQKTDKDLGFQAGRQWAMKGATYPELKRMASLDYSDYENGGGGPGLAWEWLDQKMGIDTNDPLASFSYDFDNNRLEPNSDEYVEAYIEGAQQIWNEVANKI